MTRSRALENGRGLRSARRAAWPLAAYACVGLALAGVVFPVLPTTPFALLAAYCAARDPSGCTRGCTRIPRSAR